MNTRTFALLVATLLLAVCCNPEDLEFDNLYVEEFSPTYAFQVGFGDYSVSDLLDELEGDSYTIDSTSSDIVSLRFTLDSTFVTKADLLEDTDIVDILQVNESQLLEPFSSIDLSSLGGTLTNITGSPASIFAVAAAAGLSFTADDLIDTLEFEYEADEGSTLSNIYYREGFFIFQVSGEDVSYTLEAINTFQSDTDTKILVDEQRDESQPIQLEGHYTNFEITRDPDDAADDDLNFIQFRLRLSDVTIAPGASITNASTIQIDVETGTLDIRSFEAVDGSFREQAFDIDPETIEFDAFEDFSDGSIRFDNPQIIFGVESYLGVPFILDFSQISVVTQDAPDGEQIQIKDNTIGNIDPVTVFDRNFDNIVPAEDQVVLDKVTTNIDEALEGIPTQFILDVGATIPSQPGSFVTLPENDEDVLVALGGEAIIPLNFIISNIEEEFDFEGIDSEEISEGDSIAVSIAYKSSIPLDITGRLGFVINNDTTFASETFQLLQNVEVADFDAADITQLTPTTFSLDEAEITNLLDASRIIMSLVLNSADGDNSALSTDQNIYFELAVLAGLTVEP